jgi:hypothetical protein
MRRASPDLLRYCSSVHPAVTSSSAAMKSAAELGKTREHAVKQSLDQVLHFQLTGMMSRAYGVPPNMTNGLCVSGMASPEGNPDVFASAAFKIMM